MKYIQGVADPVDIKLSYSDAMRGFEDRHRAAEPMLQAEPGLPVAGEQSAAGEPQLETLSPDQAESGQSSESEHTEPVQPSEDPSERQCGAVPAEQLHGAESDTALVKLPGGERDAAPAEQLPGEERDAAPAELPGEETGVVRRR